MSYSPQLGVERLVFFDDARAVADWDAQFDPIVPLERRDRQEVDAVRHEPAGVATHASNSPSGCASIRVDSALRKRIVELHGR